MKRLGSTTAILLALAAPAYASPPAISNGENGASVRALLNLSIGQVLNVKEAPYNAKCDGSTDDTAAINAALADAGAIRGTVVIPASANPCEFSNLRIWAYTTLEGVGQLGSQLQQKSGSSGVALEEQTAGNGNTYGAVGIWLRDFSIQGTGASDSTTDGINLGNVNGSYGWSSGGGIFNVKAFGFANGDACNLDSNAQLIQYLWCNTSANGLVTSGGGANNYYGIWAENNTGYQIEVGDPWNNFFGIQIESNVNNTTPLIYMGTAKIAITGVYIGNAWASDTKTFLIEGGGGSAPQMVRDVYVEGGSGPYTNTVGESGLTGTGSGDVEEFLYATGVTANKYYQNAGTGVITQHN